MAGAFFVIVKLHKVHFQLCLAPLGSSVARLGPAAVAPLGAGVVAEPAVLVVVADGRHRLLVGAVVLAVSVATLQNLPRILATEVNSELLSIIKGTRFLLV